LVRYFSNIEVVHEKNPETYSRIIQKHNITPTRFLMVGNSLKSDVLPVLAIGGSAVHIPHAITWAYEAVDSASVDHNAHVELTHIGLLPTWLDNGAKTMGNPNIRK
jgi:putative hydrolase of the HAD superfamily